jgi:hypothetical protein
MKNKFGYLMMFMALVVAGCAGYFSVWGLSQLFAGASTAVIIMASGLEIGKIITTTALHRYWKKISGLLKVYLTTSVVILMFITSAGIYGFLSNAYQKTANNLELHEGEIALFESKKNIFQNSIVNTQTFVSQKNKRIDQLTEIRTAQETRLDSAKYYRDRTKAREDIKIANEEISNLSGEIDSLNKNIVVLNDSINKYNTLILELKSNSDVAAEIGPLKYISELTGAPMSKVVNLLILLLVFVFDPLAVALVLMTNRIFELERKGEIKIVKAEPRIIDKQPIPKPITQVVEQKEIVPEEPLMMDEQHEDEDEKIISKENDVVKEEEVKEEVNTPIEETPLTNDDISKIKREDIKEIRNRGFSVNVPQPNTNIVERIGSNKVIKNNDNNTVYYKKNK